MIREGWFYLYGIIYVTAVDLRISKHEGNDRSVNLALDTVLEFNNKDNGADMNFLDNVQKFIGKVKTVIANKSLKRRNFNSVNNEKLTDFILNLIQVLNKFNDTDLEYFFDIIADEMRKYHYKGCKFHELTANSEFRKSLANKLAVIKNAPASVLRRKLDSISDKIEEETYDAKEKDLVDLINSLYGESSATIFHKTLSNLDDYRLKTRVNMNLQKIIKNAIRSVLFDYYSELNSNARIALRAKLDEYYKNYIKDTVKDFDVHPRLDIKTSKTAKKTITKPKYIQQYVHLKYDTFKHNNKNPKEINDDKNIALPRSRVTLVDSYQVHSNEVHHHKRKIHADKFNKQQQLIHSKKSKTHIEDQVFQNVPYKTKHIKSSRTVSKPYFKRESIEKYDLYAHEHSKIDTKLKERTSRSIHPITSPVVDDFTRAETMSIDSRNREYIKYNKHSYKTPKEPDIDSDTYQNEESRNHKTTKSKKRDHVALHAIKTRAKLDDLRHKKLAKGEFRGPDITPTDKQPIMTLYPLNLDIESDHDVAFHAIETTAKPKLDGFRHKKLAKGEFRSPDIIPTNRQPIVTLYPLNLDIESDHDVAFHAIETTAKPKLDGFRHKKLAKGEFRSPDIIPTNRQPIVTLYPLNLDLESNHDDGEFIQRVDRLYTDKEVRHFKEPKPNLDIEFNLTPVKTNNSSDGIHKYSETDNVSNEDKVSRYKVKHPDNNFELIKRLEVIQKRGRNAKLYDTEQFTRQTMGPDSIEFLAFEDDDLGGIKQRLKVNSKHKSKLPNPRVTYKNTLKKSFKRMNTKRVKNNRLTFMTLYPEFVQKWTTLNFHSALRTRDHNDNIKKNAKNKHKEEKSHKFTESDLTFMDNMSPHIPQGIQNIINAKSATHAKTIDMILQTKGIHFKRAKVNYKATTQHEINKNKGIQIIQENFKRLSNPEVFSKRYGLVDSGGNVKSTYKVISDDNGFAESIEKNQLRNTQRRSMNISRHGPFIDLSHLTHTQTNIGANLDKYINDTPKRKEMELDHLNEDETMPQNKEESVNESTTRQTNIEECNSQRSPNLSRNEAHHYTVKNKDSTKNANESDNQLMNSNRNNLKIDKDDDSIFDGKEFALKTYNSGVNKLKKSRRGFVEVQKPNVENVDAPEVISKQEIISHQNIYNDREPKYTSTQPTKRDITLNTIQSTQNYNDELHDTIPNNVVKTSINKNKPVRSNEEHLKYSSNKNTLVNEKESNDIQGDLPKLLNTNINKDIEPYIQGTSNLGKDNKNLQDSMNIKNVEKDLSKIDNGNIVNKIYTKAPIEEVVKIEKSDNNVIKNGRDVDESETAAKSNIEINQNVMKIQETIIRQTTPSLEYFSETEKDHETVQSKTFMFRANNDDSLENIKGDSSNFKSSVTYIEPDITTTTPIEKITTPTTNYDIKTETESTRTTINELNKRADMKFSSSLTEMTQYNTDSAKIDTLAKQTSFIRPVSKKKPILDNVTNAISNVDGRQGNTNAMFNKFNGTTNSFK